MGQREAVWGNLQIVSNIEATPSVKLYDLWLDQKLLDGKRSIRLGQEGANDEMMTTAYGGLFICSAIWGRVTKPRGNRSILLVCIAPTHVLIDTIALPTLRYQQRPAKYATEPIRKVRLRRKDDIDARVGE